MALGLAQYVVFRRNLGSHGRVVANPLPPQAIGKVIGLVAALAVAVAVLFTMHVVDLANLSQFTTGVIVVASVMYFVVMLNSAKVSGDRTHPGQGVHPLFIANAVFWSLFQQTFTVLAVYSDERVNWSVFGWQAPSNWIGSIEPVWIILLSPLFAVLWTRLGNRAPTTRTSSPTA